MSRFGPMDPFYRAIEESERRDLINRLLRADDERWRMQLAEHAARSLSDPIVDRDPGDEDAAVQP